MGRCEAAHEAAFWPAANVTRSATLRLRTDYGDSLFSNICRDGFIAVAQVNARFFGGKPQNVFAEKSIIATDFDRQSVELSLVRAFVECMQQLG